ncbi:hypothetical protein HDU84_006469 [Entophlyctis sp. JEL0112]|nr:hypothetical protein HDU84_006469 [Entophlyctis sp. JEL0112]
MGILHSRPQRAAFFKQKVTDETKEASDNTGTKQHNQENSAGDPRPSISSSSSKKRIHYGMIDTHEAIHWKPATHNDDVREYHAVTTSGYVLPKDNEEQGRLEMQHYVARAALDGDFVCPAAKVLLHTSGTKVLDVGCARGFWLKCVKEQFPEAEYTGVDIVQDIFLPTDGISFLHGNVLEGLPFHDNTFDFVHQRLLVFGMPKDRFVDAIRELVRVTKPGGWIEFFEADIVFYNAGPHSKVLGGAVFDAMHRRGLDCYAATNLPWYTLKVPHGKQESIIKSIPTNWNGEIGRVQGQNVKNLFGGMEDWLHKVMGVTREEYRELLQNCFEEWEEHKTYFNIRVVYFQVEK